MQSASVFFSRACLKYFGEDGEVTVVNFLVNEKPATLSSSLQKSKLSFPFCAHVPVLSGKRYELGAFSNLSRAVPLGSVRMVQ